MAIFSYIYFFWIERYFLCIPQVDLSWGLQLLLPKKKSISHVFSITRGLSTFLQKSSFEELEQKKILVDRFVEIKVYIILEIFFPSYWEYLRWSWSFTSKVMVLFSYIFAFELDDFSPQYSSSWFNMTISIILT